MGRFLQTDPMGYQDSMNLYQAFNMNPVNFMDPFGKQHQVTVTPEGAEFERPMTVGEFWETLMESGVTEEEALNIIAESTYYSKYFWDGSLVDRIKTHRMDLSLTKSEARALGMEYNFTLKGPREQAGRLIRGEFQEFGKAALENLDRAFGDPENAALMFSGGVKYSGKPIPGKTTVYQSTASSGVTQYVGITNDLIKRASSHLQKKGIKISPIPGLQNISRANARAVEQVLIEYHGLGKNMGSLLNKINSIAKKNPIYAQALKRGLKILKSVGYPGF
jgi:hypothetical protein